MDFTEKDMYYIAEGRTNKERAKLIVPSMLLALILALPAVVLIENSALAVIVFIIVMVLVLALPVRRYMRLYKEVEKQSKEMYHQWQSEKK